MFEAPGAFQADAEGQSVFQPHSGWTDQQLRKAEAMCPMAAITVITATEAASDEVTAD
jgi:ferredoxin